jgi:dihydrodipicolinate synthase/N-acetylneuraminate lyase
MGRFSKWFHVWVSSLLGADTCCCSVMNFLGHECVKETTRGMEDQNYEDETAMRKEISLNRSFITGA